MVVDPAALEKEIGELEGRGIDVRENLRISDRAHLILPHHRALEALAEAGRGDRKIGTTQRGIGPAYEDKAGRRGIRMGDLLRPERLAAKLSEARRHYENICRGTGATPEVDFDAVILDLTGYGQRFAPMIRDVARVLHEQVVAGFSILFEGAQATLLDVDHGTYPFVTSSSAVAGGAATGLGVPPTRIDAVLGVVKAYTTRVGAGPLPSEMGGAIEDEIRERGGEYGASTGRPRRCGWFDAVVGRYATRVNGFDSLALTKLDVLDGVDEIKICTTYSLEGEIIEELPADIELLERCEARYVTMRGWQGSIAGVREFDDLPVEAREYVARLSDLLGVEIGLVSTGADREQTILRRNSSLASWFDQ